MSSNRWKWYLTLGAAGLGSAAAAIAYVTRRALQDALPRTDGSRTVAALRKPVEIIRDRWGVPHIYAQNEEDLFFAQGYVQAQDRLFQMDAQRRVGYGRLSEIAGPLAIAADRLARICGWDQAADAQWRGMQADAETRALSDAFTAGVNAFIAQGPLPAEYRFLLCAPETWHPRDSAAWGVVLAWGLSVNWQTELLRLRLLEELGAEKAADLAPACAPGDRAIFPEAVFGPRLGQALQQAFQEATAQLPLGQIAAGAGLGSNNWVLSGDWTQTGRPILANDPHLPPIFPTLWYENHLVGGRYDVTGFTTPGVPGVIIGHNRHIAWGITNGYADVQDLYVERFHDEDPTLYAWQESWRRVEQREDQIHVRGRRKPVVQTVRATHHGPIISDLLSVDGHEDDPPHATHALALRWASHDENNHLRALLGICRAANWEEFRQAAHDWAFPPQNVVYADVEGNIGYLLPGRIPLRERGDGLAPVPGWSGDYEWRGWIEADQLPALYNPQPGYIVTANNQVTGDDYPCLLTGEWLAPHRAQRIATLIEELAPLDLSRNARIQTDTHSLPVQHFVQLALAATAGSGVPLTPAAQRALQRLEGWQGKMHPQQVAPAIAYGWQVNFTRAVIYQALGPKLAAELLEATGSEEIPTFPFHAIAYELALRWLRDEPPAWVGPIRPLLAPALEETIQTLQTEPGPDEESWQWGRLHYVELHSYMARIPGVGRIWKPVTYPLGGDGNSVSQAGGALAFPPGAVRVIPSCRMILDVGDWDACLSTLPGGQSGHPASEHYQDSIEDWLHGAYHPMPYTRPRVQEEARHHLTLNPERTR